MPGPAAAVARRVVKEIGIRRTKLMVRKSGSRVVGHLSRNDRAWKNAFKHISEHFSGRAAGGKVKHTVFDKAYRNEAALKELVLKTAKAPSRAPVVSKATIDGIPTGRPVVIIEREFAETIGVNNGEPAKILRIVVDYTGKPLTAYPVGRFFGEEAMVTGGKAALAALTAASIMGQINDAYAAEAAAKEERDDRLCAPNDAFEWVMDILVTSPTCLATDPPSQADLEERVESVIREVEMTAGERLDPETKRSIREDIMKIWRAYY